MRLDKLRKVVEAGNNEEAKQMATNEYLQLEKRIEEVNTILMQQYGVYVLESLEKEARMLRYLNIALISLTAVLAVLTTLLVLGIRA